MKKNASIPLIGGIVAGIAASACCIGPLVLLMLGIGGSWISNLTALEPYRPVFVILSFIFAGFAYRSIYMKKDDECCEEGTICAIPRNQRMYKIFFWFVVMFILFAFLSPYFAPLFY